jgi:5-methylthioadenosine/S-adenosylhomocysteine deaminase
LARVRDEAEKRGLRINTHLAQSDEELKYVKEMYATTPVKYLQEANILGPETFVTHCTHITDEGIKILSETRTNICVCPRDYARRGGSTALMKFLEGGCTVGLGTDGQTDMIRSMEGAIMGAAFRQTFLGEGYAPSAQKVLELATIEAAKVVGMENEIGSLEAGKKADVLLVDMKRPHMVPNVDPVSNLVYYGNGNDIKTVIIDGKVVMEDWTVRTVNESEMLERGQQAAKNVWSRYYSDMKRSILFV